jgi:hypothetical protein
MDHQKPDNFISPKGTLSDLKNYTVDVTSENHGDSVTHS